MRRTTKVLRNYGKEVKWNADRPREAYELALLGCTDKEIAKVMGITIECLDKWKQRKPTFIKWLQRGRIPVDAKVAHALLKRALGCSVPDVHISNYKGDITITPFMKHYPPDVDAAKHWLTVRQREQWGVKQQVDVTNTNINITKIDLTGLSKEELQLARKVGMMQLMEKNPSQN
jgi:hypothetical protein